MKKNLQVTLIFLTLAITACFPKPTPQPATNTEAPIKKTLAAMTEENKTLPSPTPSPSSVPSENSQALAQLKGKLVIDNRNYLLLLGMGPGSDPNLNYQFTENYQFPHERIKQDFRLLDAKGKEIQFEEMDPLELNLLKEEPLGSGIFDPRVFRFSLGDANGPITLEAVNLIKSVNLENPSGEKIDLKFDKDFPSSKQQWDIKQTVGTIPNGPFTIKYYNHIGFNKTKQCHENIKTYFRGTFYLEAPGFEAIQFDQVVPAERKSEFPGCGGGSSDHRCDEFGNCLTSDVDLLLTDNNQYELQISGYRQIIHGPWQVKFDLP